MGEGGGVARSFGQQKRCVAALHGFQHAFGLAFLCQGLQQ